MHEKRPSDRELTKRLNEAKEFLVAIRQRRKPSFGSVQGDQANNGG